MKSWIRHLLPFGLVRASQIASELGDLGLPRRHALDSATARKLKQLNLDLLPAGALRAPVGCIVDVGANTGEWTAGLLSLCQPARVVCLEPDPHLARQLRERFADAPVQVLETAAGAAAGTVDFQIMEDPVFNSIRTPTPGATAVYPPTLRVTQTVPVTVRPLDELIEGTGRIPLLKIDVQGFEREVLAGAEKTLQRTDHVLLEVNFQPHYEGEADFFELDRLMRQHGFSLGNYSEPKGGKRQALYADMLYLRA